MKLEFRASFAKDLKRVRDKPLLKKVKETIQQVEAAGSVFEVKSLKKLKTEGRYYRIRLGDYRMGLTVEGDTRSSLSESCIEVKSTVTSREGRSAK